MNEELLQLAYNKMDTDASFEQFKADLQDDEGLQQLVYGKFETDASFEDFKSDLFGQTPQAGTEPKKDVVEVSGVSASPLADTSESLSDSKAGGKLPDISTFMSGALADVADTPFARRKIDRAAASVVDSDPKKKEEIQELRETGNIEVAEDLRQRYISDEIAEKDQFNKFDELKSVIADKTETIEVEGKSYLGTVYDDLSARPNNKYEQEDADVTELKGIYGDLDKYGLNSKDFEGFIEQGNSNIKDIARAGYFTTDTTDILLNSKEEKQLRETAKHNSLSIYMNDRLANLNGKYLGLSKKGNTAEASEVREEIMKTVKGYRDYVQAELPNYYRKQQEKLVQEYEDYTDAKNVGDIKKAGTTTVDTVENLFEGFFNAAGDTSAYLLDLVGADDSAEYQRMINEYNKEFDVSSLDYGVVEGFKVNHKGTNYRVTEDGRIIDIDLGKDVSAIADKIGLDTEAIKAKAEKSNNFGTDYSTSGLIKQGGSVLGNLAFQIAATRGVNGTLGLTSKGSQLISSMSVQSGIVSSATYEETLSQLRRANIDDEKAKGEALDLSLKLGAVTALTSIISPNSGAIGVTSKQVDKGLVKKLAASYVAGGKDAFKRTLMEQLKAKGAIMAREGIEESIQEMTELVAQKNFNATVNENLGEDVLNTNISKAEVIETFILSGATGSLAASLGKTRADFKDRLSIINQLSKDVDSSVKYIDQLQQADAISKEAADRIKKNVVNYAKYSNKIPQDIEMTRVEPLLGKLDERNELVMRKKNEDPAFHDRIKTKIEGIDKEIDFILRGDDLLIIPSKQGLTKTIKNNKWGMLTAQNPNADEAGLDENKEFNKVAKQWLSDRGYDVQEVEGRYSGNVEESFFVPDLNIDDAIEFAKEFNQETVATDKGLVYQDGSINPRIEGDQIGGDMEGNYSTIKLPEGKVNFKVNYDTDNRVYEQKQPTQEGVGTEETVDKRPETQIRHNKTFMVDEVKNEPKKDVSEYKQVFDNDKVYKLAKKAGVKVVLNNDNLKKRNPLFDVEGGKYLGEGIILVNPDYIKSGYQGTNVIQHEAVHAYTSAVLSVKKESELDANEKEFVDGVKKIYKSKKTFLNSEYGFKNERELVAEFLSNKSFRDKLQGKNLTFFDKVKKVVAKFLNKQTNLKLADVVSNFQNDLLGEVREATTEVKPTSKSIKQSTKGIADTIRKLKVHSSVRESMSKLQSSPAGLFTFAWDGAIETVAKSIEVTGNLAQAIDDGFVSLKNSDWYKQLSDNGKRMAERKFKDEFKNELSEIESKKPQQGKLDKISQTVGQKVVDVFTNLNRAVATLDGAKEFWKKQGLYESKAADQVNGMIDRVTAGVKVIGKSKFTVDDVSKYMYAKHALDRNQYVRDNVDEENPFGSGMTDQKAQAILDSVSDTDKAKIEALADTFYGLIEDSRKIMVKTGLMSQEAVDKLKMSNDTYVPLTGFADEQIEVGSNIVQGKKVNIKGKEFRGVTGRTTEANNVIANIVKQFTDIAIRGSKNELLQSFDNINKINPDKDIPFRIYTQENLPKTKTVGADGKVRYTKEAASIDDAFVGFKKNGKQFYIEFDNPVLAQNLNRATDSVIDGFTRTVGKLNRFLSAAFTQYNPTFMLPNFFRDLQTALINLKAQADINVDLQGKDLSGKVAKTVFKSIRTIHQVERGAKKVSDSEGAKYYEEFKAEGAKTGWANRMTLAEITDKVNSMEKMMTAGTISVSTLKKGLKGLESVVDNANTAIENGVRLSTYIEARKAGVDKLGAASLAKELTINFNRRGEMGGLMNTLYLFFNASVQGSVNFKNNMLKRKTYIDSKGKERKTLNRGQKAAIGVMLSSVALTLYNMGASGEDDESGLDVYDSIPDWEKERNLIIMKPDGKSYFKIPLPYGYNIFSNMGTMLAEAGQGQRKASDASAFMLGSVFGSFAPFSSPKRDNKITEAAYMLTPTLAKPVAMLYENKDFFGSRIYRENFPTAKDKLATSHLGGKRTATPYKAAAVWLNSVGGGNAYEESALNFHPDKAQFLVDFFGGGALKFMKDLYGVGETLTRQQSGADVMLEARDIPLVSKVYGEDTSFPEMSIYFSVKDKYRRRLNFLKSKEGRDAHAEEPTERANLQRLDAYYKASDKQLKALRKIEKKVLLIDDGVKRAEELEKLDVKKRKVYAKHIRQYLKIKERLVGDYE